MEDPKEPIIMPVPEQVFLQTLRGQNTFLTGLFSDTDSTKASFRNCRFTEPVNVANGTTQMEELVFRNCTFEEKVSIGRTMTLTFEDCTFLSDFESTGSKVAINTSLCTFNKDYIIASTGMNESFGLSGNIIQGDLKISGRFQDGISIADNNLAGDLHLNAIETQHAIYIQGTSIKRLHIRSNNNIKRGLIVTRFHGDELIVNDTDAPYLSLKDLVFRSLIMQNNTSPNIMLAMVAIGGQFELEARKLELFQATDCRFGRLWMHENIAQNTKLKFWGGIYNTVDLVNIENEGKLEFHGVTITDSFGLHNCNLGKTDFINCRIADARMVFKNSKITEIFTSVTEFPKVVFDETRQDNFQAQLLFGQLSKAMTNIGDSVKAAEYQSREILAHYRQLSFFRKSFFFVNLTKINLGLNLLSNNFGRSWGRAVAFSFGFGLLFFYLFTLTVKAMQCSCPLRFDWNLVPAYFRFMNPLRFFETEKIFEPLKILVTLSPLSYVIDFFARVVIAYGFYQIIQAFRRLGKS